MNRNNYFNRTLSFNLVKSLLLLALLQLYSNVCSAGWVEWVVNPIGAATKEVVEETTKNKEVAEITKVIVNPTGIVSEQAASGVVEGTKALDFDVYYGNYCGKGNKSDDYSLPPIDVVDEACMEHDKCYDDSGQFDCFCDKTLAVKAASAAGNPNLPRKTRIAGTSIVEFFASTPCDPGIQRLLKQF